MVSGKEIELKFPATCKDCGAKLPVGAKARYYGPGRIYGMDCHQQSFVVRGREMTGRFTGMIAAWAGKYKGVMEKDVCRCGNGMLVPEGTVGSYYCNVCEERYQRSARNEESSLELLQTGKER